MSHKIQIYQKTPLDLFRKILPIILFIIATPTIISGYIGILPKKLGLEIFILFIAISIVYFTIDKLIEKFLSEDELNL